MPEVQAVVRGDFIVLPCDLICEVPGESLIDSWMILQAGLGGVGPDGSDARGPLMSIGGEKGGRRGGLGVWYETKGPDKAKGDETDFVITTPLETPIVPPPKGSIRSNIQHLVYMTSGATLKDILNDNGSFRIRQSLISRYGRVSMLSLYRDAHIYLFPHWVMDFARRNQTFDSISEDLVGWWAKASWQEGLSEKLGLDEVLSVKASVVNELAGVDLAELEDAMDILSLSSTQKSKVDVMSTPELVSPPAFPLSASQPIEEEGSFTNATISETEQPKSTSEALQVNGSRTSTSNKKRKKRSFFPPPMLAYIHSTPSPLIRRIDTPHHLLITSLHLATLLPPHPLSFPSKSQPNPFPTCIIAPRTTVDSKTCLLDANVSVEEKCSIKESVIGANCQIKTGAKLLRCLLMEGVVVEEGARLTGCIVGKRGFVSKECDLRECEVQGGFVVPEGEEAKGEKFMVFAGLEDDVDGLEEDGGEEGDFGDE